MSFFMTDYTDPRVFVKTADLYVQGTADPTTLEADKKFSLSLELKPASRWVFPMAMNLLLQPFRKSSLVSPWSEHYSLSGETVEEDSVDLIVRILSMHRFHLVSSINVACAIATAARPSGLCHSRLYFCFLHSYDATSNWTPSGPSASQGGHWRRSDFSNQQLLITRPES